MNPQRNNIKELLRIKTGYGQHAMPKLQHTALF
jgi:hypothetical protein